MVIKISCGTCSQFLAIVKHSDPSWIRCTHEPNKPVVSYVTSQHWTAEPKCAQYASRLCDFCADLLKDS